MALTQHQIGLIQKTFPILAGKQYVVPNLFYVRLFGLDPKIMPLFRGTNMHAQGTKLMQVIETIVENLDDLEVIEPRVQELGKRHIGYGVQDAHYETVGQAFLWTIGKILGHEFTPDVQAAWADAYKILADIAIAASHAAENDKSKTVL